jgi:hypothetical protein
MSVFVKLMDGVSDPQEPEDDWTNRWVSSSGTQYEYKIHESGALLVFVKKGGEMKKTEVAFAPSAWLKVAGTMWTGLM